MPGTAGSRRASPNVVLGWCLVGLVVFPLVAAAVLFSGLRTERARFGGYATTSDILEIVQDAEVDYSLARRAGQSFMRTGQEADRTSAGELVGAARLKLRAIEAGRVDATLFAEVDRLNAQLGRYAEILNELLALVARRREIAERGLRTIGESADGDLTLYASRWNRVGLIELAASLARARVAANVPSAAATFGPDDLARTAGQALDLADTAEIPVPEAAAVVRRIRASINAYLTQWREMTEIDARLAAATTGSVIGPGQEISARFEALGNLLRARQRGSVDDSRSSAIWNDTLALTTIVLVLVLSLGAALAAWRAFAVQRGAARSEAARRAALETALAKLDAAIRAMRARNGEVVLRLPPEPMPVVATAIEPAEPALVVVAPAPEAEPEPASRPTDPLTGLPKVPRRKKLSRNVAAGAPEPPAAAPAQAEPSTDALLAMLMQSLGEPDVKNAGKPKPPA